jgi:O-antigen ligase
MTSHSTFSNLPDRNLLTAIAVIPSVDCICNQLNNALQIHLGPVSFLQAIRASLLLVFTVIVARTLWRNPSSAVRIPLPAIGAAIILGIIISKELLATGALSMESIGAYGQMAYWVMLWTTVSLLCWKPAQATLLLKGLAVGACLTAVSVIIGLFAGAGNYYKDDSVQASAGWFDTAKMITGILVAGGVITLYLGRNSRSWFPTLAAGLCFVACVLTYARAGSAALIVVLAWLVVWRLLIHRHGEEKWLNRFLILVFAACILAPAVVNMHALLARWSDVGSSDKAGSGRATFWKVAVNAYEAEDLPQQTFGIGYKAMSEMLFRDYGDDIKHTHNDMLDLLLVGGFAGAVWLVSLVGAFAWRALMPSPRSAAGAAAAAILLGYLCHSQLTGQIWGTDAMTYYTVGLTCLSRVTNESPVHDTAKFKTFKRREVLAQI